MRTKNDYVFITSEQWFDRLSLKNPIETLDHKLQEFYPEFYNVNYDLRLLISKTPTETEREYFAYNDYLDRFGSSDIEVFKKLAETGSNKNIFLNGFRQEHFEYLAPYIKETTEILYLFKCPKIYDLSLLSEFKQLKCVHIFWNNSLKNLWNMENNKELSVLSFISVSKISSIDTLINSNVEYITIDSSDNVGNEKECLLKSVEAFSNISKLKHLNLHYKNIKVYY